MTQNYSKTRAITPWHKLALVGLLGLATGGVALAQEVGHPIAVKRAELVQHMKPGTANSIAALPYPAGRAQNVAGTYTDLGTAGTAIATANLDDANSGAQDIGFTFSFNGASFTQFVLNTNGFIKLGNVALTNPADIYPLFNATDLNLISPVSGLDLVSAADQTASPTEYRVSTTGPAGSRVCTIQFKNLTDKPATVGTTTIASQFKTMEFQLKLYEGSNNIEFVYGTWTSSGNAPIGRDLYIGLKGSSEAPDDLTLAFKSSSSTAWTTTIFQTVSGTSYAPHFVRNTFLPDPGRTYRFRTLAATDAAVNTIYTMGKLAVPNSLPHVVSARVTNSGSSPLTNLPVTLTVAGANTFTNTKTVATLAPGASQTVTFDAYPTPLTLGTNTLTVTVPDDGDNSNNSLPYTQEITPDQVAYINAPQALVPGGISLTDGSAPLPGSSLAVKYKNSQPVSISQVKAAFPTGTASTFEVLVLNSDGANGTPGTILYTSPTQNRPATAGTVTVTVPRIVVPGDFYVAVRQVSGGIALGYQSELPLRANTFYVQFPGAAWASLSTYTGAPYRLALDAVLAPVPTCVAPSALAVNTITTTTAVVTFTGTDNGTGYSIIYGPKGFNPATGGTTVTATASPFTLTGLTNFIEYDVYVRANCGATDQSLLTGPVSFRTACQPPTITAFPYAENFDGIAASANLAPCGIKVLNVNTDSKTWRVASSFSNNGVATSVASSGPNALIYEFNSAAPADDWFFTPALALQTGYKYQLTFKYRTFNAAYAEKLEVKFGSNNTPAGQTTTIWNNANIIDAAGYVTTGTGSAPAVMAITPTTTGNYYIGFHAYSDRDKLVLAVDDISITSSVVTGTSSALQQAINLYPNPTAGKLTLEVRGANAKNGLQVEVTNMLGQRVHTATVRDNMTSQLDLSGLANGMYVVKVRNGNDYMVRNVSVQK